MNIQYIIFDYGGTIDTNGIHWGDLIWHFYRKNGVEISEQDFVQAYIYGERTLGSQNIIQPSFTFRQTLEAKLALQLKWLCNNARLPPSEKDAQALTATLTHQLYHYANQAATSNAGILHILKDRGIRLALVSNFYGNLRTVLQEMHLTSLFDEIVESSEVRIRKPDPAIYALAAQRMLVKDPESVLVVGDSLSKDIIPAHSLGFHTAMVRGTAVPSLIHLFTTSDDDSIPQQASMVITDLSQLLQVVL